MKTLLFLAFLATSFPGHAADRDIGTIVATEKAAPTAPKVTVSYVYDGKSQLFLTLGNIAMNAGTKGIAGTLFANKSAILINPKERYDDTGKVEDVNWSYTIRYVIPNVKPGVYTLVHDDTAAEGVDRITRTVLDLTKAVKATTAVTFKDDATKKPGEPAKQKEEPYPDPPIPQIKPETEVPAEGATKAEPK
ncbi:hypothetical protein [Luteolibacter soli]|uniref:Uncharacterized protein n=1 Tax=Luteolibacter soli TaxID=3135280 RepID=A0ABU9AXM0_9BACT